MTEHDFAAWEREAALDRAVADDHEVADELRVLLQLAAPHLSAPADRMERVLARAALARRRRRRAALAAGLAVGLTAAVLAAAPALAPGPTATVIGPAASGPALGSVPPAGSPAGTPTGTPSTSPEAAPGGAEAGVTGGQPGEPTATPSGEPTDDGVLPPPRPTRFTALDGVIVDVPDSWSDLTLLATAGRPDSVGYLASQPLAREPGCQIRNGVQPAVCLAAGGLIDNTAIVSVRVVRDEKAATEAAKQSVLLQDIEVTMECLSQGGTRQLVAQQVIIPNGRAEVVELSACLRRPTQATLSTLHRVASSVRLFGAATNSPISSTTDGLP
ncbi:hypothetical protein ACFC58_19110 [Kitasatospora purpeofusca]|uniref:hypothetical protein n=1 Tax=Kitasatospora purpeofusca TaxID=67352 RepID=UPI0035D5EC0C